MIERIKVVLVDDEQHGLDILTWMLDQRKDAEILATFSKPEEALLFLQKQQPDILFLDIEMPGMNGFDLLEQLEQLEFAVVFTTAYDEFALRAFKVSAMDFLLKPIDKEDLNRTLDRYQARGRHSDMVKQMDLLQQLLRSPDMSLDKVAFPTFEGLQFVYAPDIIRCEADDNYTYVHVSTEQPILVSRTLKEVEDLLKSKQFLRVHYSHVINLNKIKKYVKGDGGYVIMDDGAMVNVSRSKKEAFLKIFR